MDEELGEKVEEAAEPFSDVHLISTWIVALQRKAAHFVRWLIKKLDPSLLLCVYHPLHIRKDRSPSTKYCNSSFDTHLRHVLSLTRS